MEWMLLDWNGILAGRKLFMRVYLGEHVQQSVLEAFLKREFFSMLCAVLRMNEYLGART